MVLEQLLKKKTILKHFPFVFTLTFAYSFIAYGVQEFFYPGESIATTLLLTILLVPSLHTIIAREEKLERKGSTKWIQRHSTIIKCYVAAFLGILFAFLIIGNKGGLTYQEQQLEQTHMKPELVTLFTQTQYEPTITNALALFSRNLSYMIIAFLLSIFYGAGAIFLIVFNASFFAAFVNLVAEKWPTHATTLSLASLTHLIPESIGFILASIAGATLSYAILHEKLNTPELKSVIRNTTITIIIAIIMILLAAVIEVYYTAPTFSTLIQ